MVYKLDKDDQRCDVTYIDWSKKYSPIPKATCDMIQPKCSSGGGGSDNTPELSCEDIKKLLKGEDKPKEDKPKEDTPNEGNKEETPKENETPKDENPKEDKPQEDKPTGEETPKENDTPVENDNPGETNPPKEEEVNILGLMPNVEGNFSVITYKDGLVKSVTENSPKKKREFEDSVISYLKSKLPEGATVEAVLGEPFYQEGSELITGKTNYTLNVRVTLNGKVYEQVYSVPHIEEEELVVTDPNEPELDLNKVVINPPETFKFVVFDEEPNKVGDFILEKPGVLDRAKEEILADLNNETLNPLLKDFKKKVVLYRDRTTMPKIGDNVYKYGSEIAPEFLITLISPSNKVYRKYMTTANNFLYISRDVYDRGIHG